MNKKDINSISDIYSLILEQADGGMPLASEDVAYDKLDQNLRENEFYTTGGETIVKFYTKKISDTEPDLLHNAAGPAVTFGSGGEGNEFYFIDGKLTTPDTKEYKAAAATITYNKNMGTLGRKGDVEGDFDF